MNRKSESTNEREKLPKGQLSVYKEKDIFFAGHAGLAGTEKLIRENKKELLERYPEGFLEEACEIFLRESALGFEDKAENAGVLWQSCCGRGGILEALYLMCRELSLGIYVDLQSVPMLWQTIELGEFFEKNPYAFSSEGCILGITSDYSGTKRLYEELGFNIEIIGRTTADKTKILKRGDEEGNLNRPGRN